jgi:hypothetical protein
MTMPDNMGRLPKIGGAVDLVICLDITGSMAPCIKGLRRNLGGFVEALESPYYNEGAQCVTKVTSLDHAPRALPGLQLHQDLRAHHRRFPLRLG